MTAIWVGRNMTIRIGYAISDIKLAFSNLTTKHPLRTHWKQNPQIRITQQSNNCTTDIMMCFALASDDCMFQENALINIFDSDQARKTTESALVSKLDSYLLPKCKCRFGFHWYCKIHRKWMH